MKWNLLNRTSSQACVALQFFQNGVAVSYSTKGIIHSLFIEAEPDNQLVQVKDFVTKNRLSRASCSVVLSEQAYRCLLLDPPKVAPEELPAALPWLVKDLIDIPIEQAAIDAFYVLIIRGKTKNSMP